jgi:2,3-bisphosphoglycerate-independent phosphoglycerate mutase
MDYRLKLLQRLARPADTKMVLLVLDGVGDLRTSEQPRTALEKARLPNFDALARRSSLGHLVPTTTGITPGSGPGHLALFGYDPMLPETDIGRGVLEALGLGIEVRPGDVAARGNFATADAEGRLTDRRAGRIPNSECERLCAVLNDRLHQQRLSGHDLGVEAEVFPGEAYRFVLMLRGAGLHPGVADTDPQKLGVAPLAATAKEAPAESTAARVRAVVEVLERAIAGEPTANRVLLRGFSQTPSLPQLGDLYGIRCGAFAGYPLYRGVAGACGMEAVPCGKTFAEIVTVVEERWQGFDYFFLHVKQTDQAGEDGNLDAKVAVLESVDADLPRLLALEPDAVAVTGDHSTPAPMKSHSWHPVPLLLHSATCFVDDCQSFGESEAIRGAIGTIPARDLFGLLLAHAGRLQKFGA